MADFNDIKNIRKIDKSNMLDILLDLPGQCKRAIDIASGFRAPAGYKKIAFGDNSKRFSVVGKVLYTFPHHKNFDKIFFTGLGGSAIGGDIVRTYLSAELDIPVIVNRNYDIPEFVNKNTLAFVSSYSGNTEETLSAYKQIKQKSAKIICIASGGKLRDLSLKDKIPCIPIPKGVPPRTAIGYMTLIPLIVLSRMKMIKRLDRDLEETIKILASLREKVLKPSIPGPRNIAKDIALKIYDKFVIIYGPEDFLGGVVSRCRQELEENSKILCGCGVFPEMNHNEITGWEDTRYISKDFAVIFLRDPDEHPRVSRRIRISKELIEKRTKNIIEVESVGKSLLARTFSLIYIGTFVSFYLAILNDVDPTPVANVTYLKKQLAK